MSEGQTVLDLEAVRAWRRYRPDRPDELASASRSAFQRDCDRILYASAFRRLAGVTQVVSASESDGYHTRLTHSLKVAQVGRRLAEKLISRAQQDYPEKWEQYLNLFGGCDADVVEAAGLAHDLGHPPFGHHGEAALDAMTGGASFNGNAQAFRVVVTLAHQDVPPGLNLSRATLNALLKYPWTRGSGGVAHDRWSVYETEKQLFQAVRGDGPPTVHPLVSTAEGGVPCLEAAIMDWADDITYAVHDVEDFYRAGLVPLHQLTSSVHGAAGDLWTAVATSGVAREGSDLASLGGEAALEAAQRVSRKFRSLLGGLSGPFDGGQRHRATLKLFASDQIGHYLDGVQPRPPAPGQSTLEVNSHARHEVALLKELIWHFVIGRPGLASIQVGQAGMLRALFSYYLASAQLLMGVRPDGPPSPLEPDTRVVPTRLRDRLSAGDDPRVAVRDLLGSLTELQVVRMYRRLTAMDVGSVTDAII